MPSSPKLLNNSQEWIFQHPESSKTEFYFRNGGKLHLGEKVDPKVKNLNLVALDLAGIKTSLC